MSSFGAIDNIKLQKTCEERLHIHVLRIDLRKQRLEEKTNIKRMKRFWKLGEIATRKRPVLQNADFIILYFP